MMNRIKNKLLERPDSLLIGGLLVLLVFSSFQLWVLSVILISLLAVWFVYLSINDQSPRKRLGAFIFYVLYIVMVILLFADIYRELGIISSSGETIQSSDYIYFSIVTFTTLGFGDFIPTAHSRLWAATEAMLGYVFLAIFVGLVIKLLANKPDRKSFATSDKEQ